MAAEDKCADKCPDHAMNQNRLPSATDDSCNTSGTGFHCVGAIWEYNPAAPGANTAVNGNCLRMFINTQGGCSLAAWKEICTSTGNPKTALSVGWNNVFTFPNVAITFAPYERVITPDSTGAITYNPANGRFTASCPGIFHIEGHQLYANTTYQNAGNLVGIPNPDPVGQQIELTAYLRKNGTGPFTHRLGINNFREGRHFAGVGISGEVDLAAGDYFEIGFYNNHNQPLPLSSTLIQDQVLKVWRDGC